MQSYSALCRLQSVYCYLYLYNHRLDNCWKFPFIQNFQTGCGAPTQFSIEWAPGVFHPGKQENVRSLSLATRLYLLSSLRMCGAIPPLFLCALIACAGKNVPLFLTYRIGLWNVDTLEIIFVLLRFLCPAYECYIPCAQSWKTAISTLIAWIHIYLSVFFTWMFNLLRFFVACQYKCSVFTYCNKKHPSSRIPFSLCSIF